MKRKFLYLFLFLLLIFLSGIGYFLFFKHSVSYPKGYCAFCDPKILERQKFYEDDLVIALFTHKPIFPGHCLIIPKRHTARFENLTEAEMTQIQRTINKVHQAISKVFGTSPYLLLEKNGNEVGQTVFHVHFHYIPRKKGDTSALKFFLNLYIACAAKPLDHSVMRENVQKLQKAMEEVS